MDKQGSEKSEDPGTLGRKQSVMSQLAGADGGAFPDDPFRSALCALLHNHIFDHGMGAVIMFNMVMIIVETDYAVEHDDSLAWAGAVGWGILIVFIIELILRLFVLRAQFFLDAWNTFDFLIVVTDSMFSFIGLILDDLFPMSTLRVFRLCKLARVSKVFRVFPELRIMMAGLLGSIRAIFWGTVLLTFVLLVWAIIAVQFIHPLNKELAEAGGLEGCERCPRAYSSVMQATLTFSQQIVCGDSWGQATIPVIEAYPATAIYFLGVFLTIGFAVMNLILGVVVNVAQSEHDRLQSEMEAEEKIAKLAESSDLLGICEDMDADGSGELTKEELIGGYREREDFRSTIDGLDLKEEDLVIAFASMDPDKSGTVSYKEFVHKIYTLRDSDLSFLMEQTKYQIFQVKDIILNQMAQDEAREKKQEKLEMAKLEAAEVARQKLADEDRLRDEKADEDRQKLMQMMTSPPKEGKEQKLAGNGAQDGDGKIDPKKQSVGGDDQAMRDILDALKRHLEGEVRDTLKKIDSSLDKQSSLLNQSLGKDGTGQPLAGDDLVAVPRNMGGTTRLQPAPMCCRA